MYDYVRDGNCPFSPTPISAKWETSAAGIKLPVHKGHGQLLPVPLLIVPCVNVVLFSYKI